jgi:hypothetical protein
VVNYSAEYITWSNKGVSYFISTCGSTEPSEYKYEAKYEDDWGHTSIRLLDRPKIADFLYHYLPLIDEHNKQRQNLLGCRWLSKDCRFRLLTTIIGMSVVDMHCCYRYYKIKVMMGEEHDNIDQIRITQFTNFICGQLEQWQYKQQHRPSPNSDQLLTRIYDSKTGQLTKPPNDKQCNKGRNVGNPVELTCFMCHHYRDINGNQICRKTAFWCKTCHMPLCKTCQIDDDGGRQ